MKKNRQGVPSEKASATKNVDMQEVSSDKLSKLHTFLSSNQLPGDMERGLGAIPEVEALEFAARFEREFDIAPEEVHPCVATIYYQGVTNSREPYAFLLASELNYLGVCENTVQEALQKFNSRLSKRLPYSEMTKFRRKFKDNRYKERYGCNRAELRFYCIGEACPWRAQRRGMAKKGPILSTFFAHSWPVYLKDPYAGMLYLGLQDLRQLKGLPPDKEMRFNYPRIISLTSLSKSIITKKLKKLEAVGLIEELTIGSKRGTGKKRTRVKLAHPMPEPKFWTESG